MIESWLQEAYRSFADALLQGRLPGSVILAARPGVRGGALAARCAKLFLCHSPRGAEPCGECRSCRMFEENSHPDFAAILSSNRESALAGADFVRDVEALLHNADNGDRRLAVRIENLRRLSTFLTESAAAGHGKAAVIANAHLMPPGAANAVLKTFEEPPAGTLIIMLAPSFASLLPTVVSRAFKIRIPEATPAQAQEYLNSLGLSDPAQNAVALCLCGNAPVKAAQLAQEGAVPLTLECVSYLAAALCNQAPVDKAVEFLLARKGKDPVTSLTLRELILREFLNELLQYKAHTPQDKLPLLGGLDLKLLCQVPAQRLFEAQRTLRFVCDQQPLIPARAPHALLRTWLDSLRIAAAPGSF